MTGIARSFSAGRAPALSVYRCDAPLGSSGQRLAALAANSRLAHQVRARGAEAASDADEAAKREQAADQQPEDGRVEDRVDGEAGPERTEGKDRRAIHIVANRAWYSQASDNERRTASPPKLSGHTDDRPTRLYDATGEIGTPWMTDLFGWLAFVHVDRC